MARIRIGAPDVELERPLATSTLLGRHFACTWPLPGPRTPLYWVELRWVGHWAWRVLTNEDETRGPGRVLPGGWRRLRAGDQLHGPGDVTVHLLDDGAPEAFAVDLESGEPVDLAPGSTVTDGAVVRRGERILRTFAGRAPSATERGLVDLADDACELEIQERAGSYRLVVLQGSRSVELDAEAVRALVPYVEVRLRDLPPGGWLELDAAHFRWQQLGGSAQSDRNRIAQDRSRLCRTLAQHGVTSATTLFETKRTAEGWLARVTLPPERLGLR